MGRTDIYDGQVHQTIIKFNTSPLVNDQLNISLPGGDRDALAATQTFKLRWLDGGFSDSAPGAAWTTVGAPPPNLSAQINYRNAGGVRVAEGTAGTQWHASASGMFLRLGDVGIQNIADGGNFWKQSGPNQIQLIQLIIT